MYVVACFATVLLARIADSSDYIAMSRGSRRRLCRATVKHRTRPFEGSTRGLGALACAARYMAEREGARDEGRAFNHDAAERGLDFSAWAFSAKTTDFVVLWTTQEDDRTEHRASVADFQTALTRIRDR